MKPYKRPLITGLIMIAATLLISAAATARQTEKTAKVAVLPFKINSEKNLDFLQDGIMDMLSSRLSWQGKVEVLEKEYVKNVFGQIQGFTGQSRALMAGAKLKADYVLYGSVTILGANASIDAKLLDVAGKNEVLPFSRQAQGLGNVIPQINRFATDINETVFNRRTAPTQFASDNRRQKHQTGKQFGSGFIVNRQAQNTRQQGTTAPNKNFIVSQQGTAQQDFWRSGTFNFRIKGLATGDVDNDGQTETVLISDHAVYIYRAVNDRFAQIAKTGENRINSHIAVDVADINNNGTPEIFVTSIVPDRDRLRSFVLEFDGSAFKEIAEDLNWYFRTVDTNPGEKQQDWILLGQEQKSAKDPFYSSIYKMKPGNNRYIPGEKFLAGGKANVLGVAFGDITANDTENFVAFNKNDYIRILNPNGGTIWKGRDKYGGSMAFVKQPPEDPTNEDMVHFLPTRLNLADTNNDGKLEVITAANFSRSMLTGILAKYRKFKSSHMESLYWDGMGLSTYWKTRTADGRVSDFIISDFDNDGIRELLIGQVEKEGTTSFTDAKSYLIGHEL